MKEKYTCILVDDEPKVVDQLEDILTELYDNIDIVGKYYNWKDAFNALQKNDIDIAFMDIHMPQKSGIAILRLLPDLETEVIFVTADPSYALEAFEIHASGYVVKPVQDTMLKSSVDRVLEIIDRKKPVSYSARSNSGHIKSRIGIPNENGMEYVNLDDIVFIEATMRYTKIKTVSKEILSSYSIGKFKYLLNEANFYQVHRSFIININYVDQYKNSGSIVMSDKNEIPIVKNVREDFLKLFSKISR